ncbi:MAG: hypothetical protein KatS3mg010_1617 [Acidimicrobiia bacterium]|nr:MAG: hypothetical protein KatS3mg010_1617 [Acidimicrobiia bacterium]
MNLWTVTRVEMRRALTRRLVRWMIVAAIGGCVLAGFVAYTTSADPLELVQDPTHPAYLRNWWVGSGGDGVLLVAAVHLAIGAAICGASVAGAEWKHGTVTTLLTWDANRRRVHAARTLTAAVLSFLIAVVLQGLFLASFLPAVVAHGSTEGVDAAWWSALLLAVLRIAAMTSFVAVVALSLATIGRSTTVALVVVGAWALAVEGTIRSLKPGIARFLIGENVAIVVPWSPISDAPFERGPLLASATLVAYLAVTALVAGVTFVRRDVAGAA